MKATLAYGSGALQVELPSDRCTLIEPTHVPGLDDERSAVESGLAHPTGCRPLLEWIQPGNRICIVFTDITRATPNARLIPWLLDYLHDVPSQNITLLNALGTHSP